MVPIIFNIRKINSKFSHRCLFHPSPSCLCFPALPPFFFKDSDFLIMYPFICGRPLHSFLSTFVSGDFPCRCSTVSSSSSSVFFFFSGGFKSSFVDHTFFLISVSSHTGAPHYHSTSRYLLFRSAQDISKIRVSTLHSFKLFRDWYLIQVI